METEMLCDCFVFFCEICPLSWKKIAAHTAVSSILQYFASRFWGNSKERTKIVWTSGESRNLNSCEFLIWKFLRILTYILLNPCKLLWVLTNSFNKYIWKNCEIKVVPGPSSPAIENTFWAPLETVGLRRLPCSSSDKLKNAFFGADKYKT